HLRRTRSRSSRTSGGAPAARGLEDHGVVGCGDEGGYRLGRYAAFAEDLAGGVHEAVLGANLVDVEPG
ncbi:MAG TPA: hypothetical protein PL156_13660, partial [Rhodoglobus sp.]|nr:hypothetical protein [Rhodoglobus sp.]